MERTFTEAEMKEIYRAQEGLQQTRFDVDGPGATQNANLILNYFNQNPSIAVTVDTIYDLINQNKDRFIWLTPSQHKYYSMVRNSAPSLVSAVAEWLQGRQRLLVREGDESFENATILLQELRGWQFSDQNAQAAIGRAQAKNLKVHFVPDTRNQNSYLSNPLRHVDEPKKQEEDSGYTASGLKNHASSRWNPKPSEQQPERQKDSWERVCELLVQNGKSHSEKAEYQQIVDNARNQGSSWSDIGMYLQKIQNQRAQRMNWLGAV